MYKDSCILVPIVNTDADKTDQILSLQKGVEWSWIIAVLSPDLSQLSLVMLNMPVLPPLLLYFGF